MAFLLVLKALSGETFATGAFEFDFALFQQG